MECFKSVETEERQFWDAGRSTEGEGEGEGRRCRGGRCLTGRKVAARVRVGVGGKSEGVSVVEEEEEEIEGRKKGKGDRV